ncbi:Holliday junction resolvase RuvX [Oceanirhabdus seepicola]|uniref:Putative pre-16S rRNA nuclease n=1 Tax=Oceanirhabdus seepicola TaxID=2828781 RepID=A0A9J6P3X8_9CLOT|nr:Holliday junction resolvase RuvX [Oceanirhabdus seepicola]MCM1990870.1 Holliday junction resolvase RuvX [Oceanirhabdus seepicola]
MRVLGLDIGDRTIGIAVSDPLGLTAQGITTIRRKSIQYDMQELKKIIDEYSPTVLVCGLPKNMNGTIGEQGEKAIEFSEKLKEEFNIEIEMWDERLTSKAANRIMIEADFSRKKRKGLVDKIAATYILQGYLDKIR